MNGGTRRGGVLLRIGGALHFVPVPFAHVLARAPDVSRVPGSPAALLGVVAFEGDILPVVAVGDDDRTTMLVVIYANEPLGIVGAHVVASGVFDVGTGDRVVHEGETAKTLDLGALYGRLQVEAWAGRWTG